MTVHILLYGQPLCGFSKEYPKDWPKDNTWVSIEKKDSATCEACKNKAEEIQKLLEKKK